jgi:hypothetical protein
MREAAAGAHFDLRHVEAEERLRAVGKRGLHGDGAGGGGGTVINNYYFVDGRQTFEERLLRSERTIADITASRLGAGYPPLRQAVHRTR